MNNIILINGDCITEIDKLNTKIDLVLSDPPYNINYAYHSYSDNLDDMEYVSILSKFKAPYRTVFIHYAEETMKYFIPALGVPDKVMAWCYNSNLPRQFRLINFWNCTPNKANCRQPYKNPRDKRIKKLIEAGSTGTPIYDWFSDIQIVKNVSKKFNHPCPIPVELARRIILMTTKQGDTVMDPFMGSGTVGVACKQLNRKFIGIDIDASYVDIADKRINEER